MGKHFWPKVNLLVLAFVNGLASYRLSDAYPVQAVFNGLVAVTIILLYAALSQQDKGRDMGRFWSALILASPAFVALAIASFGGR